MRKKRGRRQVRTCRYCGNRVEKDTTIYQHLVDEHDNDTRGLAMHLSEAWEKLLNWRRR